MPEPMGKLDTVEVNGPEDEIIDWDAVLGIGSRMTYGGCGNESSRRRRRGTSSGSAIPTEEPSGLLEPVAWKAGTAGCMSHARLC